MKQRIKRRWWLCASLVLAIGISVFMFLPKSDTGGSAQAGGINQDVSLQSRGTLSVSNDTQVNLFINKQEAIPPPVDNTVDELVEPSRVPSNNLPIKIGEVIPSDYEEREVSSFGNGKVRMTMVVDGLDVKYLMVYNESDRTVYAMVRENNTIYETSIEGNTVACVDYQFSLIKSPPDDPDDPNSIHYPEGISIGLGG